MNDFISREKAIKVIKWWFDILEQNPDILVDAIMTLPSADQNIAQVEKIETLNPKHEVYKCLNCGQYMHKTSWSHSVNYCSNCGAELDW